MDATPLNEAAVRDALRGVVDPELGDNIVDLGMVDDVKIGPGGEVVVRVALTTPSCPLCGARSRPKSWPKPAPWPASAPSTS